MERTFDNTLVSIVTGDLTQQPDMDAIVNAANRELRGGDGVCGAIFKAAGWDKMQASCWAFDANEAGVRCPTGEARITLAHALPNKAVVHAVGPIYTAPPEDATAPEVVEHHARMEHDLRNAYRNALLSAESHKCVSIAFPALSCGIFRYPLEAAANTAMGAVAEYVRDFPGTKITEIRFVFLPFGDGPDVMPYFVRALREL